VPTDILIYALVAAGLVFWLKSIIGTRHGDERERPNPFTPAREDTDLKPQTDPGFKGITPEPLNMREGLERHMNIEGKFAEDSLREIAAADRNFELPHFLNGAQEAFIAIVTAFAAGDRETLQDLLSEPVYNSFEQVITDREKSGQKAEVEIQSVRRTDVMEASLKGEMAYITVRFIADETNVLRNKDGEIISGDPDQMNDTIDIWTFGRNISSKDPSWLLYETRDEDAVDDDHKTVPDVEK
jgi:hypothetical protein